MQRRTDPWAANDYEKHFDFVTDYGIEVIGLLSPQRGEKVLDLGCGTGRLTHEIAQRGADVTGVDHDDNMIAAARRNYPALRFDRADGEQPLGNRQYDAVFSNAALHWMTRAASVVQHIAAALHNGGRFVAEMGGAGNIAIIERALDVACRELKLDQIDFTKRWYYPSPGEYCTLLEAHGFEVRELRYFDRPTLLTGGEDGLRNWIRMFVPALINNADQAGVESLFQSVESQTRDELHHSDGWFADYKRLRFSATLTW